MAELKIKTINIKNFKSIKEIEINCNDGINAFIGKNGTGKSAVFDAVHFVLGESYPMPQSFQKCWFNNVNLESSISISFQDSKTITFKAKIEKKNGNDVINGGLDYMKGDERNKYKINYLGADRTIKSIMPTNGWSLLGKYFYSPNFFKKATTDDFTNKMSEAMKILLDDENFKKFETQVTQEFSTQINRADIKADFTLYDKNHFLKSLEFYNDKGINLADEGSGIQNSFIIACLRALAEHRGTNSNPIFIDEPELYLHPHAKKSLYNTLKKLSEPIVDENGVCTSEEIQIFYITHSSEFLSYEDSNEIIRFYSNHTDGTKHCNGSKVTELTEIQQSIQCDKISFNNAFFADTVLLVEGYSDLLFLQYVIESKNQNKAIEDFNISIVNCGGKDNIMRFYQIYNNLKIVCFALFDKDNKDDNDIQNTEISKIGYGFVNNLESFVSGEEKVMKDCDKTNFITAWINGKINPNQKQSKIDEVYNKITKHVPSLKHNNDYIMTQDDDNIVTENAEHTVVNW